MQERGYDDHLCAIIKLGNIENLLGMQLEIEDIRSWQNEGVSYRVLENENNAFSFNCKEFYVELG